ncbi:hypothetical protein ACFWHW_04000 [Streptomyces pharetrae]|uniref:hypothetical protein n=1 Tax=Streptomyces pharetrae TaxID=291370 RepID=UPI003664A013
MNTRLVNAAAQVIFAAQKNGYATATGWAMALESAQLLQSPETAAELEAYRALELGHLEARVSATCADPGHPTWLRAKDDERGCPWCRIAELEQQVAAESMSFAERARLEESPARRQGWQVLAAAEASEQTHASLLALPLEDPHDSPLHHEYRLGRDLPATGGA